jgi:hemerythrin-like domain-containing protein
MPCNASDMFAVHAALREPLESAPALIRSGIGTDPERRAAFVQYLDTTLQLLHGHHTGEDDLVWPKLIARRPDDAAEITRVAAQHSLLDPALRTIQDALEAWSMAPAADTDALLLDAVDGLRGTLLDHLSEEERIIVPMIEAALTQEEWAELPGHALMLIAPHVALLAFGMVLHKVPEEFRPTMLGNLPEPVLEAWNYLGRAGYERMMKLIGPAT